MWLSKGSDVTSDNEIQYISPPWCQGQVCVHPIETEYGVWGTDVTAGAVADMIPPEAREPEVRGPGRWERLRRQDMEEDVNHWEWRGNVGVQQGKIGVGTKQGGKKDVVAAILGVAAEEVRERLK